MSESAKPPTSITSEQQAQLLPIVVGLLDASARKSHYKFVEAASYALERISDAFGQEAADAVPLATLQGAYVIVSERYKARTDSPMEILSQVSESSGFTLRAVAPVWNLVAMQGLRSRFGKRFFHLTGDELSEACQKEGERLRKEGYADIVVSTYLWYAPLVAEPEAIARASRNHGIIRHALPEVTSVDDALQRAHDSLNPTQVSQLRELLLGLRPARRDSDELEAARYPGLGYLE